jgi:hypothetical protein
MPKRQRITKNAAAALLGRLGGLARRPLESIPAEKRREYARHAAQQRWAKVKAEKAVQDRKEET